MEPPRCPRLSLLRADSALCRGRTAPGAIGETVSPRAAAIAARAGLGKVRAISAARLRTSPSLHLRPIDVIVSDGPVRRSYLGGGFVLRCFQHLSWPDAATRRCPWRDNRRTGGLSDTVLSY